MKRYPCRSRLTISYKWAKDGSCHIFVNLQHYVKHVLYYDVRMPPEALQMIQDLAEWSTPAAMAVKIQLVYPQVTTKQIHAAWRELSQTFWQQDDEQLHLQKSFWPNTATALTFLNWWGYLRGLRCLHGG